VRGGEYFKLALLGPGQMFGEDDVIFERRYTSSVFCRSNTGVLFCMKNAEFFRKLKSNEDCWKTIFV